MHFLEVTYNKEGAFQVVGLAIAQKIPNHDDGEHKQYNHEDLEVEIHVFAESPSYDNYERSVEQGGLDRGADAMEQCEVLRDVSRVSRQYEPCVELTIWPSQASSTAVKCSAAFSTRGSIMRPRN